jgi:HNH endonuclease
MRHGGEKRGNSKDRRMRKLWMLAVYGNGAHCPCTHCGHSLTMETVEADRIIPGGPYRRENIQPACRQCNLTRSNNESWQYAMA